MRVITLWQPWATLIAEGRKTFETRSWDTRYRGPVAIHAGLTVDRAMALDAGYKPDALPLGAIVAVAMLVGCMPADRAARIIEDTMPAAMAAEELANGDFSPGRWAWELGDIHPVPALRVRGHQGLWDVPQATVIELRLLSGQAGR